MTYENPIELAREYERMGWLGIAQFIGAADRLPEGRDAVFQINEGETLLASIPVHDPFIFFSEFLALMGQSTAGEGSLAEDMVAEVMDEICWSFLDVLAPPTAFQ